MQKDKPKKHKLLRKHRIVVWEDNGRVSIGKIVDSTLKQNVLKTNLKVGEIVELKRDSLSPLTIDKKRVWLRHLFTHDISDTMHVPINFMRLPTERDKKIYKLYRV